MLTIGDFNSFGGFFGTPCIMRILFDYKYNKYLGSLEFVLATTNNRTINRLFVCTKANYGREQLRRTIQ